MICTECNRNARACGLSGVSGDKFTSSLTLNLSMGPICPRAALDLANAALAVCREDQHRYPQPWKNIKASYG